MIYDAIDEINLMNELNIEKSKATNLYGANSPLDSLGLVNLIVGVEDRVNAKFESGISIADEKAMSQVRSPFKTVETLADYIVLLLNENE